MTKSFTDSKSWRYLYKTDRWRTLRSRVLFEQPLCRYCLALGILHPSEVVDHIKPHKGRHDLFFTHTNLQGLCKSCHDMHKQRQERSGVLVGGDTNGRPVDSAHHWNKNTDKGEEKK